jgi:hypothetical protein
MANKLVKFEMEVSPEWIERWCAVKGYQSTINQMGLNGQETVPNPESQEQFFERVGLQELKNVCILPIQNDIYQRVNQTAQTEIEALRVAADNAIVFTVTEAE